MARDQAGGWGRSAKCDGLPCVSSRSNFGAIRRPTTLSYLAGLLEGEGSFLRPPPSSSGQIAVALSMTDEDVVQRAALLLEAPVFALERRKVHYKPAFVMRVRGRRAIEVMTALRPRMGERRRSQIDLALSAGRLGTRRVPYATEIASMTVAKANGKSRGRLAEIYGPEPGDSQASGCGGVWPGTRGRVRDYAPERVLHPEEVQGHSRMPEWIGMRLQSARRRFDPGCGFEGFQGE